MNLQLHLIRPIGWAHHVLRRAAGNKNKNVQKNERDEKEGKQAGGKGREGRLWGGTCHWKKEMGWEGIGREVYGRVPVIHFNCHIESEIVGKAF